MRIAFLGNGMTGYLDAQYRALASLGHELLVVQPGGPDAVVEAMRDSGFSPFDVDAYAQQLTWHSEPDPADLRSRVATFAPDAVSMTAWNFARSYRAVMKSLPPDVVRILVMDNLWRSAPRQWLGRMVSPWYVQSVADVAMVPSERSEAYARMLGFGPTDVIRGSLSADTSVFASPARSGAELASRRSFLYVGRLVDHKGADVLADAYAAYRAGAEDPWDLHVVGLGPLAPALSGRPGVVMHGFLEPAEVAELMRSVSCQVVPSRIEPYGVIVHEAAACGLPILCSDFTGALAGYVQDGANGWIVPAGDAAALGRAMHRMQAAGPDRLEAMSTVALGLAGRWSPQAWARHLAEQISWRRHERPDPTTQGTP